jgi:hypothetical protein
MPEARRDRRGIAIYRHATDWRLHQMLHLSFAKRFLTVFLAILLLNPVAQAASAPQQPVASPPQIRGTQPAQMQQQSSALPDAPSPQEVPQNAQQTASQSTSGQQQTSPASPVGTAAAPAEEPVGTTGSRPAGAVIAPAKQRRVHTFLISVALIAGAGIAIGTVAALTHASPSQPH